MHDVYEYFGVGVAGGNEDGAGFAGAKAVASKMALKSPVLPKVTPDEVAGLGSHFHRSETAEFGRPTPPQEQLALDWMFGTSPRVEPR